MHGVTCSLFFVLLTHFSDFLTEGWKVENKKNQKHIYKISTDSYITFIQNVEIPISTLCCWILREKKQNMIFLDRAALVQSPHSGTTGI